MSSTATLVGLLVVASAAGYVYLESQKKKAATPAVTQPSASSYGYVPPVNAGAPAPVVNVNLPQPTDPAQAQIQAQLAQLQSAIAGVAGAAGGAAGQGAGAAVVSGESGFVKGAGSARGVTNQDILSAVENSQHSSAGAGEAAGAQGGGIGGAIGAFIPSLFAGVQSGIVTSVDASRKLPGGPSTVYEVPLAGAVYRGEDWLGQHNPFGWGR